MISMGLTVVGAENLTFLGISAPSYLLCGLCYLSCASLSLQYSMNTCNYSGNTPKPAIFQV